MPVEVLAPITLVQSPISHDSLVAVFGNPTDGLQWECDVCTSFNDNSATVCEICDAERLPGMYRPADDDEKMEEREAEPKREKKTKSKPTNADGELRAPPKKPLVGLLKQELNH